MTARLAIDYFKQIYEHIQDGIIVMKSNREIVMMNPAAKKLTGWNVGEAVPYCTYCMGRKTAGEEPVCYLISNSELPSFLSQMPTYHGKTIDVEMSTAAIYAQKNSGETEYLLVLRDQQTYRKAQETENTKKMIRLLIEAKESEHKRLAQELHDGIGQSLFTVSVALQAVESFVKDNPKLSIYIREVQSELQRAMDDVNAYAHQLRPHSLDQLGLEPTIQMHIDKIMKNHPSLMVYLTTKGLDRCEPVVEINLYRVVQEALQNVVKYANATEVLIDIVKDKTHIYLRISDNGFGFNPQTIKGDCLGLKHMRERIDVLNGRFELVSEIGKGTKINAVVPRWRPQL